MRIELILQPVKFRLDVAPSVFLYLFLLLIPSSHIFHSYGQSDHTYIQQYPYDNRTYQEPRDGKTIDKPFYTGFFKGLHIR